MDLRQIRYFVALYEEQSITKAARRLHVVQPAVSNQIRQLEETFGVSLFDRTPRGVYPTAVARALYPDCVRSLAQADQIEQTLRKARGSITGSVALGITPSIAQGIMPELLVDYCARYPTVQIRCFEAYSATLAEWVWNGVIDLAILNGFQTERRLKTRQLWSEDLLVIASREAELDQRPDFPAAELVRFKLILPTGNNSLRILLDTALEPQNVTLPSILEIDSFATVLRMVRHPGWASIVPGIALYANPDAPALSAARLVDPSIRRSIVVAMHPSKEPSSAAETLLDSFQAALRGSERPADAPARHHGS